MKLYVSVFCPIMLLLMLILLPESRKAQANEPNISLSNGYSSQKLTDHSYYTNLELSGGTIIRIDNASKVHSLYIEWDLGTNRTGTDSSGAGWFSGKPGVKPWVLRINNVSYVYGQNGFLHEYLTLPDRASVLEIIIPDGGASLCGLYPLTEKVLPDWVQQWQTPHKAADLLVLSTHADDEILFFGGTIPYYTNELKLNTQVVYFTYHTEKCRTHELLNGLYYCGIRNYPVIGNHEDIYSTSLSHAKELYDYDRALEFVVTQYRRFQPSVVVTHDLNGEYGHGVHCLVADLATKALLLSNHPTYSPSSVTRYGLWNVKKAYLHLYPENPIDMEWEMNLSSYENAPIWDVTQNALNYYDSQLKYYGESLTRNPNKVYDCTRFGLYRSTVGPDSGASDFFEHITTYKADLSKTLQIKNEIRRTEGDAETIIYNTKMLHIRNKERGTL